MRVFGSADGGMFGPCEGIGAAIGSPDPVPAGPEPSVDVASGSLISLSRIKYSPSKDRVWRGLIGSIMIEISGRSTGVLMTLTLSLKATLFWTIFNVFSARVADVPNHGTFQPSFRRRVDNCA